MGTTFAEIAMPRLSDSMVHGLLLRWCVQVGDTVQAGDVVAEVETDKANMEIETLVAGVVEHLCAEAGDEVPVGQVLAVLRQAASANGQSAEGPAPDLSRAPNATEGRCGPTNASPLALRIAMQRGLDISRIQGSGPGGRIMKEDVLANHPAATEAPTRVPLTSDHLKSQQTAVFGESAIPEPVSHFADHGAPSPSQLRPVTLSTSVPGSWHAAIEVDVTALFASLPVMWERLDVTLRPARCEDILDAVAVLAASRGLMAVAGGPAGRPRTTGFGRASGLIVVPSSRSCDEETG